MNVVFIGAANPETIRMIRAIQACQDLVAVAFLDNDEKKWGKTFHGIPIRGGVERAGEFIELGHRFVNLITGDLISRFTISRDIVQKGGILENFIHPTVNLEMVDVGVGNYIQEGVVLQAGVEIGDNSSIHMGSLIGHETRIGHSTFIAHAVSVSGCCSIGDGCFIGTNATVLPRVSIGNWAIIGAGSVITKDVGARSVVVGNPGRFIRVNDVPYEHARMSL